MDNFVVSARKYRPQNFSTVIGQSHITTTLKNAIRNNQLAHAFLFCGPRGVGKTTCARILAKTINCENITPEGEACNTCQSCISFDNGASLNIHELDAASNNSVDDIRNLVEQVRFAPQAGKYKVYIVDEVHMLSASAFNAFLKTLEEPPPYAIFILATTEKHKILPTILSRCQIFDFKRITTQDTVSHLQEICDKENIHAEKSALHTIAIKSEGCMRDALSILDKIVSFTDGQITYSNTLEHLNILDEDYYFKWLDLLEREALPDVLLVYDEINQKGFDPETVLEGFTEFIRNLFVCKDEKAIALLDVSEDFRKKYKKSAKEVSTGWLIAALNLLTEGISQIRMSRNKRLHVEMLLIKLSYLNQAIEFRGSEKKKITDRTGAVQLRSIPIIKIPQSTQGIKEEDNNFQHKATLMVEDGAHQPVANSNITENKEIHPTASTTETSAPPSSLTRIRSSVLDRSKKKIIPVELNEENLKTAWNSFVEKLSKSNKRLSVTFFSDVKLKIENENQFDIICSEDFASTCINKEKTDLIEHIQSWFKNHLITFRIRVIHSKKEGDNKPEILTARQQYQLLIENNPHIRDLKDKLRLELGL